MRAPRAHFPVWIHSKRTWNQRVSIEMTADVVWRRKLLAGGFFAIFPRVANFCTLPSWLKGTFLLVKLSWVHVSWELRWKWGKKSGSYLAVFASKERCRLDETRLPPDSDDGTIDSPVSFFVRSHMESFASGTVAVPSDSVILADNAAASRTRLRKICMAFFGHFGAAPGVASSLMDELSLLSSDTARIRFSLAVKVVADIFERCCGWDGGESSFEWVAEGGVESPPETLGPNGWPWILAAVVAPRWPKCRPGILRIFSAVIVATGSDFFPAPIVLYDPSNSSPLS